MQVKKNRGRGVVTSGGRHGVVPVEEGRPDVVAALEGLPEVAPGSVVGQFGALFLEGDTSK